MADRAVNLETVIGMVNTYFCNVLNLNPDLLIDGIVSLPTVNAVPVVRCKDCIRFRPDDDVWGWCTVLGKVRCKDYCSYGVREDGDDAEGTIQKERS